MEEKEVILTQEGFDNLEKELNYLRTEKRAEIADRIKVALGFGDLSENSEYDEAKTAQAENEVKIAELENKIRHAKIIDESEIIYVFCDAVNNTLYLERVKNSITPFAPSTNTNNPTSNVDNTPVFTNIG